MSIYNPNPSLQSFHANNYWKPTSSDKTYSIYCITHLITKKQYIGISKDFIKRKKSHLLKSSNSLLNEDINIHGEYNININVIDKAYNIKSAKQLECDYICSYQTLFPHGYNTCFSVIGYHRKYLEYMETNP